MESIYLVGFMGSGKSTIGKQLAKKLNLLYIDMDEQIEQTTKKQIKTIFAEEGEQAFRDIEHKILTETPKQGYVVSTGGGIIERKENRQWLLNKQVVYLNTSWDTIKNRLAHDQSRPIWQDQSKDKQLLMQSRDPKYREIAKIIVNTDQRSIDQIVAEINLHLHK
ncbi:shikimate kinase [Amphibacillus xylanus]|uniref:Shikimate kinase n=1 Tax=Amphibacillus xylanus (strain ATCC 51415 / DSM 6626 / JCM 7361 / LMG 17667 / NBRC 15112 / Ep01) TaxID=698758 RepID=K0IXZ0_AMPXN|nr:shikimate kinase [Amphibacillus xylanus]BAM47284.1 shikimate kinase [Amphibacillus xylanus NBRC 15112]